jgi:hypothetical protein
LTDSSGIFAARATILDLEFLNQILMAAFIITPSTSSLLCLVGVAFIYSYTSIMKLPAFFLSIVASTLTNDVDAIFAPHSREPIASLKTTSSYSYSHLKESAALVRSCLWHGFFFIWVAI